MMFIELCYYEGYGLLEMLQQEDEFDLDGGQITEV